MYSWKQKNVTDNWFFSTKFLSNILILAMNVSIMSKYD